MERRTSIAGCSAWNAPSRGTSQTAAKAGGALTVSTGAPDAEFDPPRRLDDLAERTAHRGEIGASRLGQRQRAIPAAKQRHAKPLLQQRNLLADRAGRHAEFARGLLHATEAGDGLERAQAFSGGIRVIRRR